MFFSAHGQRNIYYFNLKEAIITGQIQDYGKFKFPKKVHIYDMQTHPIDPRMVAACSDGLIRVWNYDKMITLKSLEDPDSQGIVDQLNQGNNSFFLCMNISNDGSKLVSGTNKGKIYCWDGRTIGQKNILLATLRVSEYGILSLKWFNYNGEKNSDKLIYYSSEGCVKMMKLRLSKTLNKIRENWARNKDKSILYGQFYDQESLHHTQNEITAYTQICTSYLLKVHPFNNHLSFNILKQIANPYNNEIEFLSYGKVFLMQDKLHQLQDYPVISKQKSFQIKDFLPNKQNEILFQGQIYYLENQEIKSFTVGEGVLKTVLSLQQPLQCDELKFYNLEFRPLTLEYVDFGRFLINYQADGHNRMCVVKSKVAEFNNSIEYFKELPCSQSFFLGLSHYKNPPIFLLSENHQGYQIYVNNEGEQDQEVIDIIGQETSTTQDNFLTKIQKVYQYPKRNGFVVIYQSMNENVLKFSSNINPENNILDFSVDNTLSCRIDSQETIIDVQSTVFQDNIIITAIICMNKVYFINDQLQIINHFKTIPNHSTNIVIQGFWFGSVLIYSTKTHYHYLTLQGDNASICSSDNIDTQQLIGFTMLDRLIVMSKKIGAKITQIDLKIKAFSILEPLLLGYLSFKAYLDEQPDENIVKTIVETYKTNKISQKLIENLCDFGFHNYAFYLITQDNCRQFTAHQKINLAKVLGLTEQFIEFVFPNKNLKDKGEYSDIVAKLAIDPRYSDSKKILQDLEKYLLNLGDFKNSIRISALLGNYDKILLVAKITKNQELEKNIIEQMFKTPGVQQYSLQYQQQFLAQDKLQLRPITSQFPIYNKIDISDDLIENCGKLKSGILSNPEILLQIKKLITDPQKQEKIQNLQNNIKKIKKQQKLNFKEVSFGDEPFYQTFYDTPEEENEKNLQRITVLALENIQQYLGLYSEFREVKKAGDNQIEQNQNQDDAFADNFDDDDDEFKDLIVYWRFDQGVGKTIIDISNYENMGEIVFLPNIQKQPGMEKTVWVQNEEGEPMELEDNWGGKKCPVQYSIDCQKGCYILGSKIKQLKNKLTEFTFELWVNLKQNTENKEKQSLIMLKGKDDEDQYFNLYINQQNQNKIELQIQDQIFLFKQFIPEDGTEDDKLIGGLFLNINKWTHISLVYNLELKKFIIYSSCRYEFRSDKEFELDDKIFNNKFVHIGYQFQGYLTEFRFRKQRQSLSEIKEQFRTPLSIVAEKIKDIKVIISKMPQKAEEAQEKQIKNFKFGFPNINDENQNEENEEVNNEKDNNTNKPQQLKKFAFSNPQETEDQDQDNSEKSEQDKEENQQEEEKKPQQLKQFQFALPEQPQSSDSKSDSEEQQEEQQEQENNQSEEKQQKNENQQQEFQQQQQQNEENEENNNTQEKQESSNNNNDNQFQNQNFTEEFATHSKQTEKNNNFGDFNDFNNFGSNFNNNFGEEDLNKKSVIFIEKQESITQKLENSQIENQKSQSQHNLSKDNEENQKNTNFGDFGDQWGTSSSQIEQNKDDKQNSQQQEQKVDSWGDFGHNNQLQSDFSKTDNKEKNGFDQWGGFGNNQEENKQSENNDFNTWNSKQDNTENKQENNDDQQENNDNQQENNDNQQENNDNYQVNNENQQVNNDNQQLNNDNQQDNNEEQQNQSQKQIEQQEQKSKNIQQQVENNQNQQQNINQDKKEQEDNQQQQKNNQENNENYQEQNQEEQQKQQLNDNNKTQIQNDNQNQQQEQEQIDNKNQDITHNNTINNDEKQQKVDNQQQNDNKNNDNTNDQIKQQSQQNKIQENNLFNNPQATNLSNTKEQKQEIEQIPNTRQKQSSLCQSINMSQNMDNLNDLDESRMSIVDVLFADFQEEEQKQQSDNQDTQNNEKNTQKLSLDIQKQIQTLYTQVLAIMQQFLEHITNEQYQEAQKLISQGFQKIHEILKIIKNEEEKNIESLLENLQKVVKQYANYKYILQLQDQVVQLQVDIKNIKKELFLHSILVSLPMRSNHKVMFLVKSIIRNLDANNTVQAFTYSKTLEKSIQNVKNVKQEVLDAYKKCQEVLNSTPNKINTSLERVMCPYCLKSSHFKGNKACSKCFKQFEFCYQTLTPLTAKNTLYCSICESIYSKKVRKVEEKCGICKVGSLAFKN